VLPPPVLGALELGVGRALGLLPPAPVEPSAPPAPPSVGLTESFNALPGRKEALVVGPILISRPVRGFLPVRAFRSRVSNVPNPVI
jgi:hypothetical protein